MTQLAYRRIVLKLSGEALMGDEDYGIDPKVIGRLAREVIEAQQAGAEVALVVGGSCSACHVRVRPAAMQILKNGREIIYCDSCKRILYYDPQSS